MSSAVRTDQRFNNAAHRCPICQGWAVGNPQCKGYEGEKAGVIFCGNSDYAGSSPRYESGVYKHWTGGTPCNCGVTHLSTTQSYSPANTPIKKPTTMKTLEATYDYESGCFVDRLLTGETDKETGKPEKTFTQYQIDDNGMKNPVGFKKLYNLTKLKAAKPGENWLIAEGEKKVDTLSKLGYNATCNVGGSAGWKEEYGYWKEFAGKGLYVYIWPDNDTHSFKWAEAVKADLAKHGVAVGILTGLAASLPHKGDVVDWAALGGKRTELEAHIAATRKEIDPFEKYPVISAVELMSKVFAPIKWVIPKLLPEGSTIIAARPKIGKSWMMMQMAYAVATGQKFMGMYDCEQGDVLYCALEDNQQRLQNRLDLLLGGMPVPKKLTFQTNVPKLGEGLVEWLTMWLTKHPDTRLIVIDTLGKVKPTRQKEESIYEADYRAGEGIKALTDHYRFACVMVYHTRKAASDDPMETVSGSFGLTGGVDNVWVIERKNGEDGKLDVTGRDIEEQSLVVSFSKEDFQWTCRGDASQYELNQSRDAILGVYRENGNVPVNPVDMCKELGKDKKEYDGLRKLMVRMFQEGKLARDRAERYYIAKYKQPDPNQDRFGF